MPVITQYYKDNNTLEPELSYPDNQLDEEAVEVIPWQSACLVHYATFVSPHAAGISHAALNSFMGNIHARTTTEHRE